MKTAYFLLLFHFYSSSTTDIHDLKLDGPYTTWTTNGNLSSILFRVVLNRDKPPPAIRVSVSLNSSSLRSPLTVTVIQGKNIHSFALPRVRTYNGRKYEFWEASDTLCNVGNPGEEVYSFFYSTERVSTKSIQLSEPVYLSITSSFPCTFNLSITSEENYRIGTSNILSTSSPSEPSFYLYTFPDEVEKVNIRTYSDSRICAKLIARRANKSDIGSQIHLAVSVEPDDSNCNTANNRYATRDPQEDATKNDSSRVKTTTISVIPVSGVDVISFVPVFIYIVSMGMVLLITYLNYRWYDSYENNEPNIFEGTDTKGNVLIDKVKLFQSPHMIVSHHHYQKQRLVKDIKYFKFLFFQIFGSILPALTILFQNRPEPHNLDTCYLNYLCAQDVLSFYSFNAMSSSSSMAVIGILNLIIVFRKKIFRYQVPRFPKTHGIQKRDAPKVVFCLGLIAMSIPRMIIYNCQDKSTEHFYVYGTAWVNYAVIFWVYSRRHGVRKWQQFFIISVSSTFGIFTLAEKTIQNSSLLHLLLKILYFIFTNFATGFFCYKYYYERPSGLRHYQCIRSPLDTSPKTLTTIGNEVYQPLKSKIILTSVSMLYSIICSSVPLFTGCTVYSITDFYIQSQLTIYAVFYYIQKIRFEWRSFTLTYAVYTVFLTFLIAFFSCINCYLGSHKKTFSVSSTPAQSREFNIECILPGIDWSHIRQYIGALVWFVFLLLMDYLDSNIKGVPKKQIFVF
ncbi:unnamed protein product [Caenorhabditis brenneri]